MKTTKYNLIAALFSIVFVASAFGNAKSFAVGSEETALFGVHEISVPGSVTDNISFTFENGSSQTVHGFYDNGGQIKARFYCSKTGTYQWKSSNGASGSFKVSSSSLKGKMRASGKFLKYENGDQYISIMDTAYVLFNIENNSFFTSDTTFKAYVADAENNGATMLRVGAVGSATYPESVNKVLPKIDNYYQGGNTNIFNYANFQSDDRRLRWMLENHPNMQVQYILYGITLKYKGVDTEFWPLGTEKRLKLLQFMIDRYAAFPNVNFLIYNDVSYDVSENRTITNEAGNYLVNNDPFKTMLSTGHVRDQHFDSTFTWASYYHLETRSDLDASSLTKRNYDKPVVNGEDLYEKHTAPYNDANYFFRRLNWSWVLSGSGAAYGGIWWKSTPYSQTGYTGMHSLKYITIFLHQFKIQLDQFEFNDSYASNGKADIDKLQVMKSSDRIVVYNPKSELNIQVPGSEGYTYIWFDTTSGKTTEFRKVESTTFKTPAGYSSDIVLLLLGKGVTVSSDEPTSDGDDSFDPLGIPGMDNQNDDFIAGADSYDIPGVSDYNLPGDPIPGDTDGIIYDGQTVAERVAEIVKDINIEKEEQSVTQELPRLISPQNTFYSGSFVAEDTDQDTEWVCGISEENGTPPGDGWVNQGNGCYHRYKK